MQLAKMLTGLIDTTKMEQTHPSVGPLFFIGFVVVVAFLLLNLVLAISIDSYLEVNSFMSGERQDVRFNSFVRDM